MEYGLIYIKVLPPIGHPSEWIRYCYIFSFLPTSLQNNIKHIANNINTKWSNDIVIPMDVNLHPGCVTSPEIVEEIATDMFNQFSEMMERHGVENCIRCVYTEGELRDVDSDSLHHIPNRAPIDPILIKLGRYLDESDETGLYKI
jgi:hypothetical protein